MLSVCCVISMNLPDMLGFDTFAMIRTCTHVQIPAIILHKGNAVESMSKLF